MKKITTKDELIKLLRDVSLGNIPDIFSKEDGLCGNIELQTAILSDARNLWHTHSKNFFKEWSKFSGCRAYPVPYASYNFIKTFYYKYILGHPKSSMGGIAYVNSKNKYNNSPYGKLRKELAGYLADRFEEVSDETCLEV